MIEVTDEIHRAYSEAWFRTFGADEEDVRRMVDIELADPMPWRTAALAAVLALAERRWQEQYGDAFQAGWWRGQHELCPRCGDALEREARGGQSAPRAEVVTWDFREQPDHDQLAAAISRVSAGAVHACFPDTGDDQYALVLSSLPLTPEAAARLHHAQEGSC